MPLRNTDTYNQEKILTLASEAATVLLTRKKHANKDVFTFITGTLAYVNTSALFTTAELNTFTENVFRNPNIRDFVMEFSFQFHARLNMQYGDDASSYLADELSDACIVNLTNYKENFNLVPEQIVSRLMNPQETISLLKDNKWLLACVVMTLLKIELNERDFQ